MNEVMNHTAYIALYLSACFLNGIKPDEEILRNAAAEHNMILQHTEPPGQAGSENTSFPEELLGFCVRHSISALVCEALESSVIFDEWGNDISRKWKEMKSKAVRKNLLMDAAKNDLFRFLDSRKIWYMPLKGSVLRDLYPGFGLRQMADMDILIDEAGRAAVKEYLTSCGYSAEKYNQTNHDVYFKEPIYNFEIHTALFNPKTTPVFAEYYRNVASLLLPDGDSSFGRHFSPEDFYIHMILHALKHFAERGTGLRTLIDEYVYVREWYDRMDQSYIEGELKKVNAIGFEQNLRHLSSLLFARPEQSPALLPDEQKFLQEFIRSGSYGEIRFRILHQMENLQGAGTVPDAQARFRWFLFRFFPGREWCRGNYPLVYRYPVLLPFLWVYRAVRAPFIKTTRERIRKELKGLKELDKAEKSSR